MHAHAHARPGDDGDGTPVPDLADPAVTRAMWIAVGVGALAILVGLVLLWPSGERAVVDPLGLAGDPIAADVTSVEVVPCSFDALLSCKLIEFVPSAGPDRSVPQQLEQPRSSPIRDGDPILLDRSVLEDGTVLYTFYDFERSTPMLLLVLLFVTAIIVLGRWRGVGALAGLALSLAALVVFTLPAILDGSNAVLVAIVTAALIAYLALFLAHGVTVMTAAALLSTLLSLALTALLALVFTSATRLTGLDDSVGFLDALGTDLDPRGLLLAGIVIGALGVLDDVTVTQVSAVWELRRAAPDLSFGALYASAIRIGRDHISSTVNTLFLAYAGAALPLLLLFSEASQGISSVATREVVAVEIVRALVGSLGLVAAVPIATLLAAVVTSPGRGDGSAPAGSEVA
jgi:uncharacterized membrane protein